MQIRGCIVAIAGGLALGALSLSPVILPTPARGQSAVAKPDKAALDAKVAALTAALSEKRYGALAADIPPKMLDLIASELKVPRDQLLKMIVAQLDQAMAGQSIDKFEVQPGEIRDLANGAPYALLPNVVVMTVNGRKATSRGHVVAIVDDGKWYLARISEQQWPFFVRAYPAYEALNIPKEKLEFAP
jgi:hypothetical protein